MNQPIIAGVDNYDQIQAAKMLLQMSGVDSLGYVLYVIKDWKAATKFLTEAGVVMDAENGSAIDMVTRIKEYESKPK
jgi:hypothetical protein